MLITSTPTVEALRDASQLAQLREEWTSLLASSRSNCFFLTWEWLHTWWKHLAGPRRLFILTVRRGSELVGLAPLCLRPSGALGSPWFPGLELLGAGTVGSDYLDLIVKSGCEPEVLPALARRLDEEGTALEVTHLRSDACITSGFSAALENAGWTTLKRQVNICPHIPLAGQSWDGYLATLGAESRYNFRRKLRRLQSDFRVTFDPASTEQEWRESMDVVFALHNMRWQERGGSDAFGAPALVAFHREVSQLALNRGWLRLYVLRLDEKPVACLYGFLYRRVFYFYQSGFDPSYAKYSVGLVAMGLAIKSAIEEGAHEYDLLHGDEDYKSHWSRECRELYRLELYPPGTIGWGHRSSVELMRASKRVVRHVLPPSVLNHVQARLRGKGHSA